jgi:hypothetical protein
MKFKKVSLPNRQPQNGQFGANFWTFAIVFIICMTLAVLFTNTTETIYLDETSTFRVYEDGSFTGCLKEGLCND